MYKNIGPSIEPWDLPVVASGFCMDFVSLITNLWPHKFTCFSVHLTMHLTCSNVLHQIAMMLQENSIKGQDTQTSTALLSSTDPIISLQKSIRSVRHKSRLTTLNHLPVFAIVCSFIPPRDWGQAAQTSSVDLGQQLPRSSSCPSSRQSDACFLPTNLSCFIFFRVHWNPLLLGPQLLWCSPTSLPVQ